jgi:hypothetical protein
MATRNPSPIWNRLMITMAAWAAVGLVSQAGVKSPNRPRNRFSGPYRGLKIHSHSSA